MTSAIAKRKILIISNWKSNGDRAFTNKHCMFLSGVRVDKERTELLVAPPYIHLMTCKTFLCHLYTICSQNISAYPPGPYTGEISAKQIKDLGINYTLIGQSERRKLFNENENVIGEKILRALENDLNMIICINDNGENNNDNINTQMETIFNKVKNWEKVSIAYETEKNLSVDEIEQKHKYIRDLIEKKVGLEIADKIRIVYGGSVNEQNCIDVIKLKNVDGFLLGDICLKAGFSIVVDSAKKKTW